MNSKNLAAVLALGAVLPAALLGAIDSLAARIVLLAFMLVMLFLSGLALGMRPRMRKS